MSASAKLVSLSAVSCASTSIISLFAIQYSYLIVDQEVIKYPSNIPQRLLYRCERKSLHLTHIHHVDQRFFWGRAPSAVWLKTTSRMTSMPRRWSSPLRQHKHNLTWSNMIKHDQTYVSLVFECTYVTNFYYPKVGVHDSEAVQQRSKTLQRSKASESFWSKTISNTAQLQNLFSLFSISGAALKHFWSLTKRRTMVLKPTIAAPIRSPQDETGWFKQTF